MKTELDNNLCEKFPKIFRDRYSDMTTTAMCWGFEHGDGWYEILRRGCALIQGHIDWRDKIIAGLKSNNPRGVPIPESIPQVVAVQVKEKFGTLRFYYDGGDEFVHGVVSMMEAMSAVTCEVCGKPGSSNNEGWITTTCEEHK